jgi:putative transposase
MELSEMQRLRQLEDENRRLKHIVAEQTLDIPGVESGGGRKWQAPSRGATGPA